MFRLIRFEPPFEESIERIESGLDTGSRSFPFSFLEVRKGDAEFELESVETMEVSAVVGAHAFELSVDGFDGIGGGERLSYGGRVVQKEKIVRSVSDKAHRTERHRLAHHSFL